MALPLAPPGIISVIVFSFTLTLHEFIYALVFITRSEWRTLSVGVPSELILGDVFFWQPLLALLVSLCNQITSICSPFQQEGEFRAVLRIPGREHWVEDLPDFAAILDRTMWRFTIPAG